MGTRHVLILPILFLISIGTVQAQEFNCSVSVNYQNLSGSDYDYLQELSELVREYMNQRIWTEERYRDFERIDCGLQLNFMEAITLTSFSVRLIVVSRRPIYNATQQSTVVQFSDDNWQFNYARGTPLIFDPEVFNPLTSVLNFYAFLLLGYDYDSFAEFGGTPYFERARRISELAEAAGGGGWSQIGADRSRGKLIAEILDPRFRSLRKGYFDYHFGGLDQFVDDAQAARISVFGVLEAIGLLYEEVSRSYVLDVFFTSKYQELTSIFQESPLASQAYELLSDIDAGHLTEYSKMIQ